MKVTAVIMAGGRGERFWPKSRGNYPKQFLSLTKDGETMIQKTVKRLLPMVAMDDVFVVTNVNYAALVKEQLPQLPEENILLEPCARNTAPCIGLAAAVIRKKYGEAMMLVLPSDHLIRYEDMYVDTLRQAVAVAEKDQNLVTIGITPTYPETGYGYINFERDTDLGMAGVYRVERFVEKPDLETAKQYLASHRYLWNSGMFVWKASSILANLESLMPTSTLVWNALKRLWELRNSRRCWKPSITHSAASPLTSVSWKRQRTSTLCRAASAGTMWETGWQWNASTPPMNTATTSRAMSSRSAPNAAPFAAASV